MTARLVLVIKREGLAALLDAEPILAALRHAHPGARLDFVTTERFAPLVRRSPHVDRVLSEVRAAGVDAYDVAYDLDGIDSGLRAAVSASVWIGPQPSAHPLGGPAMRKLLREAGLIVLHSLPDPDFGGRPASSPLKGTPFALLLRDGHWPASYWDALAGEIEDSGLLAIEESDLAALVPLARTARFFVSDGADAACLALASRCPGVLLSGEDASPVVSHAGHDVIRLVSREARSIEPAFVLQTLRCAGHVRSADAFARPAD
ncbi:glycosyltransferase family 9 protein [Parvularcula dongshanensis]|uniref:Uncharacterized protein n=1 Tax=Parvularcula dongshanensis TaxID=1173995 RepID=A0A840I340_9PROT|nr:hypothetical protein [Parvularcula dongshanensis]MBB4658598.1 hypothetical protein [Parvularcula dongshanensis]